MSWIVRPTLIVPGRPDAECLALARGLYRAVTWKHSSAFVVQAEGSTPEDLQSAWQRLISAIQELESGEIETTGLSGMETFEVRFIVVCNADEGSIWESARKIYRSAEELGNSSEGLVIVAAQRLSDTCERAALKFRQDCSWVPVLIEGRNSKGFPVPEAQVRDSVLTIVDLIVNSASPAEAALETFLQTSGRERRIILGAAVFDPGRDVLEALHLAAVDANYPLALAELAKAKTLKAGEALEAAKTLSERALRSISEELIPEAEPSLPVHPATSTGRLRFFSRRQSKQEAYDEVEASLKRGLREYADLLESASAEVGRERREGLGRVPAWIPGFQELIIDEVRRRTHGYLWPCSVESTLEALLGTGGAGCLHTSCRTWVEKTKTSLSKKLGTPIEWIPWSPIREIRASRFLDPRWLSFVWTALAAIGLLVLHYYQMKLPWLRGLAFLPHLALLVVVGSMIYLGTCALLFHRSKLTLRRAFSERARVLRWFFVVNGHEQRLAFVEEAVDRTGRLLDGLHERIRGFLGFLRRHSEEKEKEALSDHEKINRLSTVYSKELVRKAIEKLELEPDEKRIDEISATLAISLTGEGFLRVLTHPADFLAWARDRVSEFFLEKKQLGDITALNKAGLIDPIFDKIAEEAESNRPLPLYHKAGTIRGILFFPDKYKSEAEELLKRLDSPGSFHLLPLHSGGRFGILNLYEHDV